jgi:glycosyltransferase involved in cell wall biosynthesis
MSASGKRIVMLGLRGFPDVQGGIEKHVEALAPLLAGQGWDIEVIGRRPYLPPGKTLLHRGVTILPVWSPRRKSLETIVHTALGVFVAARRRADVLHIHAVGPALLVPLARLLGMRVVVTHHGYDYDRSKWGRLARWSLRLGEALGMRLAHGRIAIAGEVARTMELRYDAPVSFIPNGVDIGPVPAPGAALARFGLRPGGYVVTVGRLVPEKRQDDLIAAFGRLGDPALKLVLIGASDHPDAYARAIGEAAARTPGVVLAGFQTGPALAELFGNAGIFVLPSSHEGMPLALLEALGYGLPVLASDIVAHRDLCLAADDYFPLGDIDALAASMRRRLAHAPSPAEAAAQIARVRAEHSWERSAALTAAIYRDVLWDATLRTPLTVRSENRS